MDKFGAATVLNLRNVGIAAAGLGTAFLSLSSIMRELGADDTVVKTFNVIGTTLIGVGSMLPILGAGFSALGIRVTNAGIQMAAAGGMVTAAWGPVIIIFFAVAAAIAGVAYAFYKLNESSPEGKLKAAKEEADKLNETLNKTKDILDSLKSKDESIDTLREKFELMTVGTTEWKDALMELNTQMKELIEVYPELSKYVDVGENGELVFKPTESGKDPVEEEKKKLEAQQKNQEAAKAEADRRATRQGMASSSYKSVFRQGAITGFADQLASTVMLSTDKEALAKAMSKMYEENVMLSKDNFGYNYEKAKKIMEESGVLESEIDTFWGLIYDNFDSALLAAKDYNTQIKQLQGDKVLLTSNVLDYKNDKGENYFTKETIDYIANSFDYDRSRDKWERVADESNVSEMISTLNDAGRVFYKNGKYYEDSTFTKEREKYSDKEIRDMWADYAAEGEMKILANKTQLAVNKLDSANNIYDKLIKAIYFGTEELTEEEYDLYKGTEIAQIFANSSLNPNEQQVISNTKPTISYVDKMGDAFQKTVSPIFGKIKEFGVDVLNTVNENVVTQAYGKIGEIEDKDKQQKAGKMLNSLLTKNKDKSKDILSAFAGTELGSQSSILKLGKELENLDIPEDEIEEFTNSLIKLTGAFYDADTSVESMAQQATIIGKLKNNDRNLTDKEYEKALEAGFKPDEFIRTINGYMFKSTADEARSKFTESSVKSLEQDVLNQGWTQDNLSKLDIILSFLDGDAFNALGNINAKNLESYADSLLAIASQYEDMTNEIEKYKKANDEYLDALKKYEETLNDDKKTAKDKENARKDLNAAKEAQTNRRLRLEASLMAKQSREAYTDLAKTIKDNLDNLTSKNKSVKNKAIEDVTAKGKKAFGENITTEFVGKNIDLFKKFAKGDGKAIQEIRIKLVEEQGNLTPEQETILKRIANEENLVFDVDGNADFTAIFNELVKVTNDAEKAAKLIKDVMGLEVRWEAIGNPPSGMPSDLAKQLGLIQYRAVVSDASKGMSKPKETKSKGSGGGSKSKKKMIFGKTHMMNFITKLKN